MKTKEMLRKERGITLVALIITIIVLIILAAVSINAVLKTDFIGLATNGTINYAEAQVNEQKQMEELDSKLDNVIAKIEKVSSIPTFTGYSLVEEGGIKELHIGFIMEACVEFLQNKINEMTDEEVYMATYLNEYNGTFEQLVEEAYNAGEISEKYSTLKELLIKGEGMTEAEAEAEIANMRQEGLNAVDTKRGDIQIVTPTGETIPIYDSYDIPVEVKDYVFQIRFATLSYKIKVSIKPYEILKRIVGASQYVLDVQNKRYLTINSAKTNIDGREINIENKYLKEEDNYNYLDMKAVNYDYYDNILTEKMKLVWYSFTCDEGIIEDYKWTIVHIPV